MPRREGRVVHMETLSVEERRAECKRFQEHWYRFLAAWVKGNSVLDVGAGTGYGMDIMGEDGATAIAGLDPLPMRGDIGSMPIAEMPSKSFDVVVCCDVIEHVEKDIEFFGDLVRVARKHVFLSTPNWNVSHAHNEFHVREYTPAELRELLGAHHYLMLTSDDQCLITPIARLEDASSNFGILITLEP